VMRGTDGFDSIVVEKFGDLGSFGPIKFDIGLSAEAMDGGDSRLDLESSME
jgi:hypothetical protein